MDQRPGYIMSAVLKAGIKVEAIGIASPGAICYKFRIKVTKTTKEGKTIEVESKDPFKTYPHKSTKESPSVWEKVEDIYTYYYKKLKK